MKAKGVSEGLGIGKALILKDVKYRLPQGKTENVKNEITKLEDALDSVVRDLKQLKIRTEKFIGVEESMIFEAHIAIVTDPEFIDKVKEQIKKDKFYVEVALMNVTDEYITIFEAIEDPYLRERANDIRDVSIRIVNKIQGIEAVNLSHMSHEVIIISEDLTPSNTAEMDTNYIKGIITVMGGETSHSAIIARSLGIPAISGADGIMDCVETGDVIVVNGNTGEYYINPPEDCIGKINQKIIYESQRKKNFEKMNGKETVTSDGTKLELVANIGGLKDLENVFKNDAEGIGLFRSEFIYMNRNDFPNEEEQFVAYKEVLEKMNGKPVVIRTLDIGGDKNLEYFKFPKEANPFLGYRAIRFCLDCKDIFKTQLRALYRASIYGNLKIMFPMISSLKELRQAKRICEEVKHELKTEGIYFSDDIKIGIMIEIPSAAIISDILAKNVDFMSIGTNDLIQYTVAVDRMNNKISELYTPYHPALLRLIKMIIENGHKEGIRVGMCGEVAANPLLIPVLIGLGLDEFSMSASKILESRKIINRINKGDMEKFIEKVLSFGTAEDVKNYLEIENNSSHSRYILESND